MILSCFKLCLVNLGADASPTIHSRMIAEATTAFYHLIPLAYLTWSCFPHLVMILHSPSLMAGS